MTSRHYATKLEKPLTEHQNTQLFFKKGFTKKKSSTPRLIIKLIDTNKTYT